MKLTQDKLEPVPKDHVLTTLHAYNNSAEIYRQKLGGYSPYIQKIQQFQEGYIPPGANILDVGCGPGTNASLIQQADCTCSLTGVDLSFEMIKLAREAVPGGAFFVQDIRALNVPGPFNAVLASFCIVHLDAAETTALVAKLSTLQQPGDVLYLSFMEEAEGRKNGFETTSFSSDYLYFNYYSEDWVTQLLTRYGYAVCERVTDDYPESDGSLTTDVFIFARKNNL